MHSALALMKFRVSKPIDCSEVKSFMRNLLFLLSMAMTITAHAEVFKCVKDGRVSYSDNPCDGAVIVGSSKSMKSSEGLDEGLSAFENGNYALAYSKLAPLANADNAMAQNTLGRMYLQGQGVAQDSNKALALFHKAANQGLANAKNNLGVMYAAGGTVRQDYKQAVVWFREAADQGFSLAMNNLADMYENGLGVDPDRAQADMWRRKAQDIGPTKNSSPIQIDTVGKQEYEKGLELYYRWDFAGAAKWFHQAAAKGHPEAQLKLASMYQHGQGVQKSEAQALYWAAKAKEGAHTMNDGRDRVILIDTSTKESKQPRNDAVPNGLRPH